MGSKRRDRPPVPVPDGQVTTTTAGEMMEHLKRSIIAAHSPGHDPAWWVDQHEMSIMFAFLTAGGWGVADPFILGTGFDPVECSGGGFLPQERSRFAELMGDGEPLPVPAEGHFSVVVVLSGAVYHHEMPLPTGEVMAGLLKARRDAV